MRGYLERLVAGSRQPSPIRPILGSVFTTAQPSGLREEVTSLAIGETPEAGQIEHRSERVVPRFPEVDTAEPFGETPASSEISRAEGGRDTSQFNPIIRPRASFEPLMPPAQASTIEEPNAHVVETIRAPEMEASPPSIANYRPLVAENARRADSELHPFHPSDRFAAGSSRKAGPELPKRSEAPAREPDEIQIHIGRIEVVAVPQQQAARAPVKSNRKSVSLDEYLKRGRRGG